ncbi:AP2/B3-like transcriptional factor family protein [Thalictrum thalictroides]|uniref:AP2/B3-like transcriptional factor family protein n=1 Tax=Thalictrum thalictroides TaxID=46969 RepID=A0A7J6XGY2_THATH|nr:AP2/B3-like transcriptional factor family protein [Thalictrum thalictroides]
MKRNKFFSLIGSKDCQLELPSEFVEEHGNQLSDVVVLKVRIGDTWNIRLRRFAGRIVFNEGWKDFTDLYSLDMGYCLFFTYSGNSRFDVVICDSGDVEIIYPSKPVKSEEPIQDKKTVVPMSTNDGTGKKFVKKPSITSKKDNLRESVVIAGKHHQGKQINEPVEPSLCRMAEDAAINEVRAEKPLFLKTKEKDSGVTTTVAFESNNPFFKLNVSSAYYKHGHMFFPRHFLENHVPAFNSSVTLGVANMEKKWLVGCYSTKFTKGTTWRMSKGLCVFMREANIKVGDSCIFELIDKENVIFNVIVLSQ